MQTRSTKTKELVAHIFRANPHPLSLPEILRYARISFPKTAFTTVFRIVGQLEAQGSVVRVDWRERGSRYEWADLPHHHHLTCQVCGQVVDIDGSRFHIEEAAIQRETGFVIEHHSIELEGICRECQTKQKQPR